MNFEELKVQNAGIFESLTALPEIYIEAERSLSAAKAKLKPAQDTLSDAELEAELGAQIDGRNAEERKLQRLAAIAKHTGVKIATTNLRKIETMILEKEAESKYYSIKFRAAIALSELQTARMNFFSKASK